MYLLEITDGETTINLKDGTGICVEYNAWSPAISGYVRGSYPDVHESIPVIIRGASGTAVMTRLREVTRLIDQARRFASGEKLRPVLLRYQRAVSSIIWVAMIVGGTVDAPANFTNQENWKTLYPVYLEIDRRGQWLTPSPSSLIKNGSFETWSDDPRGPSDWVTDVNSGGASITKSSDPAYVGTYSAFFDECSMDDQLRQEIDVEIGENVRVSGWFYVTKYAARLMVSDGYVPINNRVIAFTEQVAGWQFLSVDIVSISDKLIVTISGKGTSTDRADFYVDHVQAVTFDKSGLPGDVAKDIAVYNGDLAKLVFATGKEPYLSPTQVIVDSIRFGVNHPPAVLIVANNTNRIKIVDSDNFGWLLGAPFSHVTDTAAFAMGGKVARYTPAGTTAVNLQVRAYDLEFYNIRRVAIWANVRNNSSTTTFTLRAFSYAPGGTSYAHPVLIAGNVTPSPQWRYLGQVTSNRDGTFFISLTASAASGTLDIDSVVLVALDGHVAITTIDQSANIGVSEPGMLIMNHRALSGMNPQIEVIQKFAGSKTTTEWTGRGSIAISTDGRVIEAVLLATGGPTNVNRWRQTSTVESESVLASSWIASRLPGRLTPE